MITRARFRAELVDADLIVVEDLDGAKSVTNDIERVVATLADYVTIGDRRIIYRDSSGRWDGILVGPRGFVGFVAIGATNQWAAVETARALVACGKWP